MFTQKPVQECVVIVKKWKQPRYPSIGEWLNSDTSIPWNTTWQ